MPHAVITGCGSYLPEKILTNHDLEGMVDTNDAWIVERTGIRQRHIAAEGELTSDMAANAAEKALESAGVSAEEIDMIILATTTPDNTFPATAARVQALLGTKGGSFDVQAVCAGFIYALATADSFIKTGLAKNILVIGADMLSRIVDWTDRGTCILFGDGAGALVVQAQDNTDRGVLSTRLCSDGTTRDLLYVDGGVSTTRTAGHIHMEGKEVFKHAVQKMTQATQEALTDAGLSVNEVDWAVPHQANMRILSATVKKMGLPQEKLIATVDRHANTSAASIPLALDVATQDRRIKPGDIVALQAIGGGLSWGAAVVRW